MSFPVTTMKHTGVAVGTESIAVVPSDSQRTYLTIQNQGSGPVWLRADGADAVPNRSAIRIMPGETWEQAEYMTGRSVMAVSGSGSNDVHSVCGGTPEIAETFNVVNGPDNVVDGLGNVITT